MTRPNGSRSATSWERAVQSAVQTRPLGDVVDVMLPSASKMYDHSLPLAVDRAVGLPSASLLIVVRAPVASTT